MLSIVAKAIDQIAVRLATRNVSGNAIPSPRHAPRQNLSIAALQQLDSGSRQPEAFFSEPKIVPDIFNNSHRVGLATGSERRAFEFPSECGSAWRANNTVRGWCCLTRTEPRWRPTVVILHGWNHGGWQSLYYIRVCRWLAQRGINSVLFDMPHHGSRRLTGRDQPRNFLTDDLLHGIQAVRQAVGDTRQIIRGLRAAGFQHVGLWGISLGAWIGALTMAYEEHLKFAALTTPAARLDEIIATQPFAAALRRRLQQDGVTLDEAAANIRFLLPMNLTPRVQRERIFLAQAQHDQFVSAASVEELWQRWRQPPRVCYPHGHISILLAPRALSDLARFFADQSRA
jgi:dienelactone hydrolase